MEEIYEQLRSAYNQISLLPHVSSQSESSSQPEEKGSAECSEDMEKGLFALCTNIMLRHLIFTHQESEGKEGE